MNCKDGHLDWSWHRASRSMLLQTLKVYGHKDELAEGIWFHLPNKFSIMLWRIRCEFCITFKKLRKWGLHTHKQLAPYVGKKKSPSATTLIQFWISWLILLQLIDFKNSAVRKVKIDDLTRPCRSSPSNQAAGILLSWAILEQMAQAKPHQTTTGSDHQRESEGCEHLLWCWDRGECCNLMGVWFLEALVFSYIM